MAGMVDMPRRLRSCVEDAERRLCTRKTVDWCRADVFFAAKARAQCDGIILGLALIRRHVHLQKTLVAPPLDVYQVGDLRDLGDLGETAPVPGNLLHIGPAHHRSFASSNARP